MTTVKIHENATSHENPIAAPAGSPSPAREIIKAATQEHTITDARGRQITLRKPGPLAQFRLVEALGATAKNELYMQMALPLTYVAAIDGAEVIPLTTKTDVEAFIQRLGDEGLEAILAALSEQFASPQGESEREAVKK